tara:strand:+ start:2937 stop:3794 length:858 start_codon:yes stop_codon:yes gene_type:complete
MTSEVMKNLPAELSSNLETTGALELYLAELRKTPLLSKQEELELFNRLNSSDDIDAARKLVMAHLRFVVHVAKTYKGYGLPLLDIIQEGNVGLMKAVKKFDTSKNVRLLSFAIYWIRAEIHEFILKNWRIVKVATTKAQRKLFFKLRSKKTSTAWLTEAEKNNIANELNVKSDTVTTMESRLSGTDVSFDPITDEDLSPSEYLADNTDPLLKLEYENDSKTESDKLNEAISKLDNRSMDIIKCRYLSENKMTLDQLATKYDVSIERIRQIENKTLKILKNNLLLA